MRRREFITSLVSTLVAWPFAGFAQTASKVYRIGVLSTDKPLPEPISGAIVRALASHGYIPDRNVALEFRASGDQWEQLPQLAKDLMAGNADVILTFSCPAAIAAVAGGLTQVDATLEVENARINPVLKDAKLDVTALETVLSACTRLSYGGASLIPDDFISDSNGLGRPGNDLTRRFPLIVETLAPARALLHRRRRSCRL